MNVAWIIDGPLCRRTGGTIYDRLVIEGLRREGVHVEVRTPAPHDAQCLLRELARSRVDVIVGDELCFPTLDIIFEHATFARRVLLVHHLTCWEAELFERERARARRLEARLLRRADRILVTSSATRDRLLAEGARAPIRVVCPGSDRLKRTARPASRKGIELGIELLFVGTLTARKRVIELIEAFAAGSTSDARLTLLGSRQRDARYVARVDELIREHGLMERVTSIDEVDDNELVNRLATADVFVQPSSLEGYGMAATEAAHAKLPIIAARVAGLVEALAPCAESVMYVEGVTELAHAIGRMTQDQSFRTRMTDAATRAANSLPKWSDSIAAFERALND